MRCDGSADPTIQGEINTYINLEREDNSSNDIDSILPKCRHTRTVSKRDFQLVKPSPSSHLVIKLILLVKVKIRGYGFA